MPIQFFYWTDPELGNELARVQNDDVSKLVAGDPDRFVAMGTLPMQDAAASVTEMRRAVKELDIRAFIISSNVDGVELSDRRFDPIYAEAVALDVPLFLHPFGFTDGARLRPFFMHNCVGQPLEEQIAISHLIFGGVLDRHKGIKICIAHGGGYFPYYAGRMDHSWEYRPELRKTIERPPSEYLRELYYDTVVFRPDQLEYLIDMVGGRPGDDGHGLSVRHAGVRAGVLRRKRHQAQRWRTQEDPRRNRRGPHADRLNTPETGNIRWH